MNSEQKRIGPGNNSGHDERIESNQEHHRKNENSSSESSETSEEEETASQKEIDEKSES